MRRGGLAGRDVPEMPEAEATILDNPYRYTDYVDEGKRAGGEERVLGR